MTENKWFKIGRLRAALLNVWLDRSGINCFALRPGAHSNNKSGVILGRRFWTF